jgi:NAD(P)H-hydrate epimerase
VGELVVADIGLVDDGGDPVATLVDGAWVGARLPQRDAASHKGSHGHLGVVAGSVEKAGAAVLVCNAAIRSGCGLVTLVIHPDAAPRLSNLRDEIMVQPCGRIEPKDLAPFDAIAVGPGFGVGEEPTQDLMRLWHEVPAPGIFDADALTALATDPKPSLHPRCISPHPGEAARLLGQQTADVQADRFSAVRSLSQWGPALLKGRHTLVCGETLTINRTGTPALATAGSGDVLTGVVGALLAQGLSPNDALVCAAFVHGLAGELAGQPPIVAGDVIEALPEAFRTVGLRLEMVGFRPLLG